MFFGAFSTYFGYLKSELVRHNSYMRKVGVFKEVDMVTDMGVDMLADMEADLKVDMVAEMVG